MAAGRCSQGRRCCSCAVSRRRERSISIRALRVARSARTEQAAQVAATYARQASSPKTPERMALIDYDQWTVSGEFDSERPLYRFDWRDGIGTQVYVSSATGRAVQITTAGERVWNWLGSVPHWLYFAAPGATHGRWWSDIVIATSLMGCFPWWRSASGRLACFTKTSANPRDAGRHTRDSTGGTTSPASLVGSVYALVDRERVAVHEPLGMAGRAPVRSTSATLMRNGPAATGSADQVRRYR